jgi:hypothetical protein
VRSRDGEQRRELPPRGARVDPVGGGVGAQPTPAERAQQESRRRSPHRPRSTWRRRRAAPREQGEQHQGGRASCAQRDERNSALQLAEIAPAPDLRT